MYSQTDMFPAKQNYSAATFKLEGVPAIWYKFYAPGPGPVAIQAGDFIRARRMPVVCGFVVARIELQVGRNGKLPGYQIRLASGRIDFIPADDAELIG